LAQSAFGFVNVGTIVILVEKVMGVGLPKWALSQSINPYPVQLPMNLNATVPTCIERGTQKQ